MQQKTKTTNTTKILPMQTVSSNNMDLDTTSKNFSKEESELMKQLFFTLDKCRNAASDRCTFFGEISTFTDYPDFSESILDKYSGHMFDEPN